MTLAGVLGANLWVVTVLVPLGVDPTWAAAAPLRAVGSILLIVLAAPALLLWGLGRRGATLLLVGFPVVTLLPTALLSTGESVAGRIMAAPPYLLCAASLLAYLFAVAHALRRAELVPAVAPSVSWKALPATTVPPRWRRRARVYRGLAVAAGVIPLALIYFTDLRSSTVRQLQASFGNRSEAAQALLTAGIGLLWVMLYRRFLVAPLHGHLQQDREILDGLEAARKQARRGRPRFTFYFAVVVALTAMAAVVWRRLP